MRTVLAAIVAALAVVAPAQAQAPGGRAGVERAKAAGIVIDPIVEPYLAQAPAGSCINDPTQAKCAQIRAIVYAPEFFGLPEATRLRDRLAPAPSASAAAKIRARAAQYYACRMRVTEQSPYKAAGYEQMDANHQCDVILQDLDIYLALSKWYNGSWRLMTSRWFWPPLSTSRTWYGSLRYDCTSHSVYRNWKADMHAYAQFQGVVYAAYQSRTNYDYCG